MPDVLRLTIHRRSIDYTDAGQMALGWVIAGFLEADGTYVSCVNNEDGFLVVRGLRLGWYHFDRPDHNISISRMANHICLAFEQMDKGSTKSRMADTMVLANGVVLNVWTVKSEELDDGTMALRVKPAYV